MKCPLCGTENPTEAKFCVNCGEDLLINTTCTSCGHENEEGFKFCASCGKPLIADVVGKKKSKKQKTKGSSKLPIKPIWLILGGIFVALLWFGIWLISPPKECLPLRDALETNEEFIYGCDSNACYVWVQNIEKFEGVEIAYKWGDLEEKRGVCNPDPDAAKGIRCTFALPQETGSSVMLSLATDQCHFAFTTLSAEEIDELLPDPNAQGIFSRDPAQCGDFQSAADSSLDEVNFLYSPIKIELFPISFDQPYLGLRYVWSNGVSGVVDCTSDNPAEFNCTFPAEMGEKKVDFWLNDGSCESLQLAADESLMDWNVESYANCSLDFVNKLKENSEQWYFTYEKDGINANRFTFWIPGITAFEDATILFTIDDNMDYISADICTVKEDGPSGMPELGCSILLEDIPDVAITYTISQEGCKIFAGLTDTAEILAYLEANPDQ